MKGNLLPANSTPGVKGLKVGMPRCVSIDVLP